MSMKVRMLILITIISFSLQYCEKDFSPIANEQPRSLPLLTKAGFNSYLLGKWSNDTNIMDVAISGNYAYLASDNLIILDISQPDNIQQIGSYDFQPGKPQPISVEVKGDLCFILTSGSGTGLAGDINIFDVSTPSSPVLLAQKTVQGFLDNFTISDNYLFIPAGYNGLRIFDISTPNAPIEVGSWDIGLSVHQVTMDNQYVYLATNSGLRILDISNISNPLAIATYGWQKLVYLSSSLIGEEIYVGFVNEDLHIVNVKDPKSPQFIRKFRDRIDWYRATALNGNYLINNFRIYNITDPVYPFASGDLPATGFISGKKFKDNHIYITTLSEPFKSEFYIYFFKPENKQIEVIYPNGNERIPIDTSSTIMWNSYNIPNIRIEISNDNGKNWQIIETSTHAGELKSQTYIPNIVSEQCLIKISDVSDDSISDRSDTIFKLFDNKLNILQPNGGEKLPVGQKYMIKWVPSKFVEEIDLFYSNNLGISWFPIEQKVPSDQKSYVWDIPNSAGDSIAVRISDSENYTRYDNSDVRFTIFDPQDTSSWYPVNKLPLQHEFNCNIWFLNPDTGFIAGAQIGQFNNGFIAKTTNGGINWDFSTTFGVTDIAFFSPNIGLAGGFAGSIPDTVLIRTTDMGQTWEPVNIQTNGRVRKISLVDEHTGYLIDSKRVWKTIDGGMNWNILPKPDSYILNDIQFLTDKVGYVAGADNYFIKTTDGGLSWLELQKDGITVNHTNLYFINTEIGFLNTSVIDTSPYCNKTTDGGFTWNRLVYMTNYSFVNEQLGYGIFDRKIFHTTDGGLNWSQQFEAGEELTDIFMIDQNHGCAIGVYGTVYKFINF